MAEPSPLVSIVMPARNASTTISDAIAAALDQDYPGDLELVVAEGASRDDTAAVLAALAVAEPRLRVVHNPTGTTPAGLNAAIAEAHADIIARCDAHAALPRDYVATAVADMTRTGADVVGGIQDPRGTTVVERAVASAMRSWLGSGGAAYRGADRAGPVDTVYLGVFRRAALERVGGFDENLIRNQDYDLNYRIRSTGGMVWLDPRLRVAYRPRSSFRALWSQYFDYGRWKRRMLRLRPSATRVRQLVPPLFVLALGASAGLGLAGLPAAALVVPGAYVLALTATALGAAARERDPAVLLSPAALAVMHTAWGLGFLLGPPARRDHSARES